MKIIIRNEEEKDFRRTEEVARDAFWNLYIPGTDVHLVVHELRKHKDYLKDLSYVIEVDGRIEGGIFYTKAKIVKEEGEEIEVVSFGPVFISPELHRQGLGRKLITHSIEQAKIKGYKGILTLGYPYHYEPYGFTGGKKYKISMEDGKFYMGLLALSLVEGAFDNAKGYAVFSEGLEDRTLEEAEEFDKTFSYKEKKIEKSQEEYEIACSTLDTKEYK